MNLSCSSKMIKYLMFGFNLFFVISGIIIIAVGAAVKTVYTEYAEFLDNKYFSLPNMLIATGAFIFMVSFFGCCGAIKESWIMLGIFSVFLCIIFIFELACGIAGYTLRDNTAVFLDDTLRVNLHYYNTTHAIWDLIQSTFHCCGVDSYKDWEEIFIDPHALPVSCCPIESGTIGVLYCKSSEPTTSAPSNTTITATTPTTPTPPVSPTSDTSSTSPTDSTPPTTVSSTILSTKPTVPGYPNGGNQPLLRRKRNLGDNNASDNIATTITPPTVTSHPYPDGCKSAFGNYIKKHAVQIGGWGLGLAVIQILGIVFSCHLVRQLKNGYYST